MRSIELFAEFEARTGLDFDVVHLGRLDSCFCEPLAYRPLRRSHTRRAGGRWVLIAAISDGTPVSKAARGASISCRPSDGKSHVGRRGLPLASSLGVVLRTDLGMVALHAKLDCTVYVRSTVE